MAVFLFLSDIPYTLTETCTKQNTFTDEETNKNKYINKYNRVTAFAADDEHRFQKLCRLHHTVQPIMSYITCISDCKVHACNELA